MKRVFLLLTLLPGLMFSQKVDIPEYKREVLGNGLVVLLMEYHKLPIVELRMTTFGGSAYDPSGYEGLASLTASLLRKGTTKRTAKQIAEEIDFVGGTLGASASRDFFVVSCEVLKKDLQTGIDLFSDIILHPKFDKEELDRERTQALADLEDLKDNPGRVASVYFNKIIYGKHPYGHQSDGTKPSLTRMAEIDVKAFYNDMFLPNASVLTLVGDFNMKEMLAAVRKTFGGWKKGAMKIPAISPPEMHKGRRVVIVNKADVTQTQIRIGNVGVLRSNPDYFAIEVANSIFGNGFTSRLVDAIRVKRSLTYGAGSRFMMGLYGGTYTISTFTKNATTREVIDVALSELKAYRDNGPTQEEVAKAQNYLAGEFARDLQAPEGLAASISEMEVYKLPADFLDTYFSKLKSITLDEVKRVVKTYFLYDDLVFLVVTPQKEVQPMVEALGPVEAVDFQQAIE